MPAKKECNLCEDKNKYCTKLWYRLYSKRGSILEPKTVRKIPDVKVNQLDLTSMMTAYPEVYEDLKHLAKMRFRSIEEQAMWLILQGLNKAPVQITKEELKEWVKKNRILDHQQE